jgi:hypothetical protein
MFNQLLASALASGVTSASAKIAATDRSEPNPSSTEKWYERLTPGIHLDYHFPEWDPFFLSKADGASMMHEMADTGTQMVVVFAKCHYGNCYYNTRIGHKHHNLGDRDLLRDWVREAKRRKLIVLAYYSVNRDVWAGEQHPEWRMKDAQGNAVDEDRWPPEWARMGFLCYNSGYRDLVKAQVRELLDYDIDGFHFDMLWFGHSGKVCYCREFCQPLFRQKYGIDMPNEPSWDGSWSKFLEFRYRSNESFANDVTELIRSKRPELSVVYNYHGAPPNSWQEGMLPVRHRLIADYGTGEGYPPRFGHRYASLLSCFLAGLQPGKPWQGVTSRYSRALNDHTVRPLADMQWETFTYLSHGGMPLFVDTPADDGGTLDRVAYSRMGSIFKEIRQKMNYLGHKPLRHVGLYFSAKTRDWYGRDDPMRYLRGFIGAHRILVESHIQVGFLFDENLTWERLQEFSVIYLANTAILGPAEQELFSRYVKEGGGLLATFDTSRFDQGGKELENFGLTELLGTRYAGKTEFKGNYVNFPAGFLSQDVSADWDLFLSGPNNVVNAESAASFGKLKLAFHDRGLHTEVGHAPHNSAWKVVGPGALVNKYGKGRTVYLPFAPEDAYMGDFPLPEYRLLVRDLILRLAAAPAVTVEAPLNVESVITVDNPNRRYIVHFVQFNGVPDAQALSTTTTLIPMMEEPATYVARIRMSFTPRNVSAANPNTSITRSGNSIEFTASVVHESIAIVF